MTLGRLGHVCEYFTNATSPFVSCSVPVWRSKGGRPRLQLRAAVACRCGAKAVEDGDGHVPRAHQARRRTQRESFARLHMLRERAHVFLFVFLFFFDSPPLCLVFHIPSTPHPPCCRRLQSRSSWTTPLSITCCTCCRLASGSTPSKPLARRTCRRSLHGCNRRSSACLCDWASR